MGPIPAPPSTRPMPGYTIGLVVSNTWQSGKTDRRRGKTCGASERRQSSGRYQLWDDDTGQRGVVTHPLAEEGKRQFNSGLSHQRHCRPSSKGDHGGIQRREGPCERYIIYRSGVSATLRGAAPDLGAARIHARSERPENPTFDLYPVVYIGLRVDGTRWAKENRRENQFSSVWEEIEVAEGEHYERK